jgi:hypothetical protein
VDLLEDLPDLLEERHEALDDRRETRDTTVSSLSEEEPEVEVVSSILEVHVDIEVILEALELLLFILFEQFPLVLQKEALPLFVAEVYLYEEISLSALLTLPFFFRAPCVLLLSPRRVLPLLEGGSTGDSSSLPEYPSLSGEATSGCQEAPRERLPRGPLKGTDWNSGWGLITQGLGFGFTN